MLFAFFVVKQVKTLKSSFILTFVKNVNMGNIKIVKQLTKDI